MATNEWACGRQNSGLSRDVPFVMLRNCEYASFHGKRDFAVVIGVKNFELGRGYGQREIRQWKIELGQRDMVLLA